MAKKKITEIYLLVTEMGEVEGYCNSLKNAQDFALGGEFNNCRIYKVTQAWKGWYPEEPDLEFFEQDLENL